MIPKEKAKELVDAMYGVTDYQAKQSALIAVDEIIKEYEEEIIYKAYDTDFELWKDRQSYWDEVKQEIQKL